MNYSEQLKLLHGPRLDYEKLRGDFLKHRFKYYYFLPIAFVLALIYYIGLPSDYTCTVYLAPKMPNNKENPYRYDNNSNAFFTIQERNDAITPRLYSELTRSPEFIVSLFDVKVKRSSDNKEFTYYNYLLYGKKKSIWNQIFLKFRNLIVKHENIVSDNTNINSFRLSLEQVEILELIKDNISCNKDILSNKVIIKVRDNDPLVAAMMAENYSLKLQDFLIKYRTSKAKVDLDYYDRMSKIAKQRYDESRLKYSKFVDSHHDILSEKQKQIQKELEEEMQFNFKNYERCYSKLIASGAEVQYSTPAFVTLRGATVPIEKSGPSWVRICLKFMFEIFLIISVYILYKEDDIGMLLGVNRNFRQ